MQNPPPTIEIPEPVPVAEAGVSTSEWKVLVAYAAQLLGGTTGVVLAKAGGHLDAQTFQLLGGVETMLLVAAVTWILGRSIRKHGAS